MQLTLQINGVPITVEVLERKGTTLRIALSGKVYHFVGKRHGNGALTLDQEMADGVWRRVRGAAWQHKGVSQIQLGAHDFIVADASRGVASSAAESPLSPVAPMPGLVRQVLVKKGERVTLGQPIAVLEAMKLQLTLSAGGDGIVAAVLVAEGDMVGEGAQMVQITPLGQVTR